MNGKYLELLVHESRGSRTVWSYVAKLGHEYWMCCIIIVYILKMNLQHPNLQPTTCGPGDMRYLHHKKLFPRGLSMLISCFFLFSSINTEHSFVYLRMVSEVFPNSSTRSLTVSSILKYENLILRGHWETNRLSVKSLSGPQIAARSLSETFHLLRYEGSEIKAGTEYGT